jgi:hypothetical protein
MEKHDFSLGMVPLSLGLWCFSSWCFLLYIYDKKNSKSFNYFMITFALPLSYYANFHVDHCGAETTPSFYRRYLKVSLGRGLVKICAICSFVPTYSTLMLFSVTCSHRKRNLIRMCFILECITRFLEILIALVLSQNIRISHHIPPACPTKFASLTREHVYNMLLLQYTLLLLWTMILKTISCSTKIPDNHPSRRMLHLYFFYHQHFLPNLHLCMQIDIDHSLLDTIIHSLMFLWDI